MKTVLITGSSDGIGRSIARRLAKEEFHLILCGRDKERLQEVKEACEKLGAKVETFAFDLTDDTERRNMVAKVVDQQIDILINNAGIWHKAGDLTTLAEEEIVKIINTNLTGHVLLTRELLDSMRNREGTAIINVVSKSGIVAQAGQSVYTASKYGMKGFTDVLRVDTKSEPIRIAGVYQSGTNTAMFAKAGEEFSTGDFTEPDDLAEVVAFMLSQPTKLWINEVHVER